MRHNQEVHLSLYHSFGYSFTVCLQSSLVFEKNYFIIFHIGSYVKLYLIHKNLKVKINQKETMTDAK